MSDLLPVGLSSYGALRGTMQYLKAEAGRQFIAWMNEANRILGYTADRHITVNEAQRSEARCRLLWGQFVARQFTPPVVAAPLTSNHYPGTAVDLGGPDAAVLTARELEVLHDTCEAFGFHATGLGFSTPELWHFDYLGGATKIAKSGIQFVYPTPSQIKKADTMTSTATDDATAALRITLDRETNGGKRIAAFTGQIHSRYVDRLGRRADSAGLATALRDLFLDRGLTFVDASLLRSAEYKSAANQARLKAIRDAKA